MVPWDPVLKKKLLNSVLVGPVNSIRDSQKKNTSIGKRASQTEAWYHEANMYTVHILRKL